MKVLLLFIMVVMITQERRKRRTKKNHQFFQMDVEGCIFQRVDYNNDFRCTYTKTEKNAKDSSCQELFKRIRYLQKKQKDSEGERIPNPYLTFSFKEEVGEEYTDASFENTVAQDGMTYDKKIIRTVYIRPFEPSPAVNTKQDIEVAFRPHEEQDYKNTNQLFAKSFNRQEVSQEQLLNFQQQCANIKDKHYVFSSEYDVPDEYEGMDKDPSADKRKMKRQRALKKMQNKRKHNRRQHKRTRKHRK